MPIAMMAVVCLLHYKPIYIEIKEYCERRATCFTGCIQNNFPDLECQAEEGIDLTYRGQFYDKLYFYPAADTPSYEKCSAFVNEVS
jgi:hypothetical protein